MTITMVPYLQSVKKKLSRMRAQVRRRFQEWHAHMMGIKFTDPNYMYKNTLNEKSVVIDVGCGYDADFSVHVIETYGATCYAIDPTQKHREHLKKLEEKYKGKFFHIPVAVAACNENLTFYESEENVSGSIRNDHVNVKNDTVRAYMVEALTPMALLERIGIHGADYLKLDLEGAEYDLIRNIALRQFDPFSQILVEFHSHCVDAYTDNDTMDTAQRIMDYGFKSFSFDNHNFLFFR
ncbi:MAG: FkbM family methyltransferase [Patescibacteria group bacterium]|nr:FkbM family methyltransferase [Patescibacteria group bacterium]MDE2438441.1 FkbM family methyltransferase [Patescibacteria group bacterium]